MKSLSNDDDAATVFDGVCVTTALYQQCGAAACVCCPCLDRPVIKEAGHLGRRCTICGWRCAAVDAGGGGEHGDLQQHPEEQGRHLSSHYLLAPTHSVSRLVKTSGKHCLTVLRRSFNGERSLNSQRSSPTSNAHGALPRLPRNSVSTLHTPKRRMGETTQYVTAWPIQQMISISRQHS